MIEEQSSMPHNTGTHHQQERVSRDPLDPERLREWEVPHEPIVLERVRMQLHERFFLSSWEYTSAPALSTRWMRWAPFAVAACAVLIWVASSLFTPSLTLEYKGTFQGLSKTKPSPQKPMLLKVASQKKGEVSVPKKWKVVAHSNTSLTFSPPSTRQQVRLQRGFIQVYVVPKQMKEFVVRSRDVRVVVKGTRFAVERAASWVRVEVWRGKVEVRVGKDKVFPVGKGQGLRWSWEQQSAASYKLPPKPQTLGARWRWLAKNKGVKAMAGFLKDMVESQRYSTTDKVDHLSDAGNWARLRRSYALAYRLKWKAFRLAPTGEGRDLRLFQAARACREAWAEHTPRCLRLFRLYLNSTSQASRNVLGQTVLLWEARAEASRAPSGRMFRKRLRTYIRQAPTSGNVTQVRRWIRLSWRRSAQGLCQEFGSSSLSTLPKQSWLRRTCHR